MWLSCLSWHASSNKSLLAAGSDADQGKPYPVFLGFIVAEGALEMAHECMQTTRLPLLLDLDETVVKAYTARTLTTEIENLTNSMLWHPE